MLFKVSVGVLVQYAVNIEWHQHFQALGMFSGNVEVLCL